MPSSLLSSRSALSSESISLTSLPFISSRCSWRSARNFLRFAAVDFLAIARTFSVCHRTRYNRVKIVAEGPLDPCADEITRLGIPFEDHHAVNFGRLRRSSPAKPRGAPGSRTLDQNFNIAADQFTILVQ